VKVFICGKLWAVLFGWDFLLLISWLDVGPPGQMKAISGPKLKPTDQGPLTGVLKEVGFDESQVGYSLSDVV
jgi:hypothetical protein